MLFPSSLALVSYNGDRVPHLTILLCRHKKIVSQIPSYDDTGCTVYIATSFQVSCSQSESRLKSLSSFLQLYCGVTNTALSAADTEHTLQGERYISRSDVFRLGCYVVSYSRFTGIEGEPTFFQHLCSFGLSGRSKIQ